MSNPNDPKKPTPPDQPNPNNPGAAKPDGTKPGEEPHDPATRSSFDFELPAEVKPYSELPPVPSPDAGDSTTHKGALPPRPSATRPSTGSFDFIDLPEVDLASLPGSGAHPGPRPAAPAEPAEPPPTDHVADLPLVPKAGDSGSSLSFELPIPAADPASFTVDSSDSLKLGTLPEVPPGDPASDLGSVPDIGTLFPSSDPPSSFVLGREVPPAPAQPQSSDSFVLPPAPPEAIPDPPSTTNLSDVFGSKEVPTAEPASGVSGTPALPDLALPPVAGPTPTPNLDEVADLGITPVQPIEPVSGWFDKPESGEVKATPPAPGEPAPTGRSSFDFSLPEGVKTYSDLPPVPQPDANDPTGVHKAALPPRPTAGRPVAGTFDFINVADGEAPPASSPSLLTPTDPAANVPPPDPAAAVGGVEPVAPSSEWLDSDVLSLPAGDSGALVPTAEPASTVDPVPAAGVEGSDIFSGARPPTAEPIESDVIAATAFGSAAPAGEAPPAEPSRPSDVALTFDNPPGGSTLNEGLSGELPVADEVGENSGFGTPRLDPESIHDLPDPATTDPLFDSSRLAAAPELPSGRRPPDDSTDYGNTPVVDADASSILADLSDPDVAPPGTDSSSVRVEAPGVGRTLTPRPAEGGFDLTVPDEPVPGDLFGEPADPTATESSWQSASGSDLFADPHHAPPPASGASSELPTEAEMDLTTAGEPEEGHSSISGQSSITAPSSIFTPNQPTAGPESSSVRPGVSEPSSDLLTGLSEADLADFTDGSAVNETAERKKDQPPPAPPKAPRRPSSGNFELPAAPAPAAAEVDWDAVPDDNAARDVPEDASLSTILRGLADDSAEKPTRTATPLPPPPEGEDASTPVVTVDWMSNSAEGPTVAARQEAKPAPAKPKEKDRKEKGRREEDGPKEPREPEDEAPKAKPSRLSATEADEAKGKPAKKGGMLVGMLLGGLLAGGAAAGVYFSGAVPNSEKGTQTKAGPGTGDNTGQGGQQPQTPTVAATGPQAAFASGDSAQALKMLQDKPPTTTEEKAAAGYVRLYAKVQELGRTNAATAAADDADLKQARTDLEAVMADGEAAKTAEGQKRAVAAAVQLGVSYELAGDNAAARKVYTDAMAKYPTHAAVFASLIDKLDATTKGPGVSRAPLAPDDAARLLFALTVLFADDPKSDDPEPGSFFWKAVNSGAAGKYAEAIDLVGKAKAAHVKRAKALAGRGLNPLTDPLEQMFPRACDEMAAYWKLRNEVYGHRALGEMIKKDGVTNTFDTLAREHAELPNVKKDLAAVRGDLKKAQAETTKLANDVKTAEKAKTAAETAKTTAENAVKTAQGDLKTAQETLKAAQADAKEKGDALTAVAAELKTAGALPEKWAPSDLAAGAKSLANRATGPDLKALVPSAMVAIGGGGLSTGQLLDIAGRMTKAEAAAKAADAKLAAETKRLNDKYDADTAKLKTDHAAEVKKLKDAVGDDVKKVTEKYTAEAKKLADDHAAAVKKLKEDHEVALKAEQAKTEAERKISALKDITFQKQLGNAITPAQAVDIWLPVLTDLRRASDAEPAMAMAARSLASSPAGSEEEAKARTVTGMALFLKGDSSGARDQFQLARKSPTYRADKAWAKAADAGLEAIDDPLAVYRQPVVIPPVDTRAAARALDLGIAAYKAGKYETAAKALTDAAKNDPSDPVAWYYLGAARWARGDTKQAEKDFGQGAEREKASPLPARTVSAALAPIQGAARAALDRVRP